MREFLTVCKVFLTSRLLLLVILVLCSQTQFIEIPAREGVNFDLRTPIALGPTLNSLERIFRSGDASWYLEIAASGYHLGPPTDLTPKNWTFFPLYPLLIKALSLVTQNELLAGLLLSNLAFLLGLLIFKRLGIALNFSEETMERALWLMCFFPVSYFFSAPLTESLFFLLLVSCFYLMERNKLLPSSILMGLLCLTRPTGMLLMPAYAVRLWQKEGKLTVKLFLLSGIPVLFFCLYPLYLRFHMGSWSAFYTNQSAWGRVTGGLWGIFTPLLSHPPVFIQPWDFVLLNLSIGLACVGGGIYLMWRKQYWVGLLLCIPLAFALNTGTTLSCLRFAMPLFPLHFFVADLASTSFRERLVFLIYGILFAILSLMYASHVTPGMA